MGETYSPIPELNRLKDFDDRIGQVYYSDAFELIDYGADMGLATWSDDPDFLERLVPFALATGSGSCYAVWRCDDRTDLADLPIVFVGDEGHLYVVAGNMLALFQLLAIDSEYLDPDAVERHSPAHEAFITWLHENFGLGPPEDLEAIRAAARSCDERFRAWAGRFVDLLDPPWADFAG